MSMLIGAVEVPVVLGHPSSIPLAEDAGPGRRARTGNVRDPFGHTATCTCVGQPPTPAGIVTSIAVEVLRLVAFVPEGFDEGALEEWQHSLGASLRIGIRHHLLLEGSEIEFEPEGPWQEPQDAGAFRRVSLTFVDPSVGGSGYVARIAREFHLIAQRALEHLEHPNCETACYRCLKSYQNQRHHDILRWPAVVADLEQLAESAPQPVPSNAATATIRGLGSKPSRQELARRWNCDSCGCSSSMESESPSFKITKRYIPSPSPSRKIFRASGARPLRKICETVPASHQQSLVGQGSAALRYAVKH
jgi:hypothetical protein